MLVILYIQGGKNPKKLSQQKEFIKLLDYILKLTDKKINITSNENININVVSSHLLEIRKDFNETLREFSKRFNTSNSTWSAYETGKVLILGAFLFEICKLGNYSIDWILGRSNTKYIK